MEEIVIARRRNHIAETCSGKDRLLPILTFFFSKLLLLSLKIAEKAADLEHSEGLSSFSHICFLLLLPSLSSIVRDVKVDRVESKVSCFLAKIKKVFEGIKASDKADAWLKKVQNILLNHGIQKRILSYNLQSCQTMTSVQEEVLNNFTVTRSRFSQMTWNISR